MAPVRLIAFLMLSVGAHCVQMSRACAQMAASPDTRSFSQARLLAAGGSGEAGWKAGIEVTLAPSIITYWRDPGEAGVPPTFDFSRSTNVASVDVLYPVPRRIHEGDIDAIGYQDRVLFPLHVTPVAKDRPAHVALTLDYATCGKICVPAHADLSLDLPAAAQPGAAQAIADAEALTPVRLDPDAAGRAATIGNAAGKDGMPAWTITPDASLGATEVFVEAPTGFFVSTARAGNLWRVTVEEHPSDATTPASLRVTIAGAAKPVEFSVAPPR